MVAAVAAVMAAAVAMDDGDGDGEGDGDGDGEGPRVGGGGCHWGCTPYLLVFGPRAGVLLLLLSLVFVWPKAGMVIHDLKSVMVQFQSCVY